jgi:predicted SnoaL-like aldol condensation-catalyzing enzyme
MVAISQPLMTRRNRILKGYAAFTDGDWDALGKLLCENVVWHKMHPGGVVEGKEAVIAYLTQLRDTADVEFMGMAIQDNVAVTVDFTHMTTDEGDHGCADRILFDDSDCIAEVWHCAAATHGDGNAGHPAS